jgi:hypothetical protein
MRAGRSGESALLLLDVVEILVARKIAYAVVGALAASVHGAVRASMDADAVISLDLREAQGLEQIFQASHFQTQLTRGDFADPIPGMLRVSDRFGNRVDLLIGLRGLEQEAFSRTLDVPFQGTTLQFICREDFIAMKVFAGGPVDIADASRAIAAAGTSLDAPLVRRLAARYGSEAQATLDRLLASANP